MFGYITIRKEELKIREFTEYQSFYCGLCYALKSRHSRAGQITLNFDMVFLTILLTGLYEPETELCEKRCFIHPTKKHSIVQNDIMDYVADMNVLLAYHNLLDGWQDEKNPTKLLGARALKHSYKKIANEYPDKRDALVTYMHKLNECQTSNSDDIDEIAGLTGDMLGAIFSYRNDEWKESLYKIGFYLGKFVYLLDAYDDLEDDKKKKQYNVWKHYENQLEFDDIVEKILEMMMAECCKEFEKLPILQNVEILRNILYSGVFIKFEMRRNKRRKDTE